MTDGRMRRGVIFAAAGLVAVILAGPVARRDLHGLTLVVRAAHVGGVAGRVAEFDTVAIGERAFEIPTAWRPLQARMYAPIGTPRHTVLLVSGLHAAGIEESRLVGLARELAKAGLTVVTPEIPELSRFEIVPAATDQIEAAARWLALDSGLARDRRVGLMGVSFSGGLALVAGGRASLRGHLRYVFAFGAHDDLQRVVDYLCTGCEPGAEGTAAPAPPPHDYGVAVVLLNVAEHLVPAEQLQPLRAAVRRFLWASYLDGIDTAAAQREFAAVREAARTCAEPSATLLRYVSDRDVARLGPRLRPYVEAYVVQPPLSPARSPAPSAPVYLLHGRDDNVIPSAESRHVAERLRGRVPVRLLVTNVVSHVDPDHRAGLLDIVRLADFWGDVLTR